VQKKKEINYNLKKKYYISVLKLLKYKENKIFLLFCGQVKATHQTRCRLLEIITIPL